MIHIHFLFLVTTTNNSREKTNIGHQIVNTVNRYRYRSLRRSRDFFFRSAPPFLFKRYTQSWFTHQNANTTYSITQIIQTDNQSSVKIQMSIADLRTHCTISIHFISELFVNMTPIVFIRDYTNVVPKEIFRKIRQIHDAPHCFRNLIQ